jgi:hypothetical protein
MIPASGPTTLKDTIELYTALMEDAASMSERRQTVSNIYTSLNGLFLTAIGVLLVSSRFTRWWIAVAMLIVTLAVMPLNLAWLRMLRHYHAWLNLRYQNMYEIETRNHLAERVLGIGTAGDAPAPLVAQRVESPSMSYSSGRAAALAIDLAGGSRFEMSLPRYFLALYPLITIGTVAVVALTSAHLIAPLGM